jgi:hypothetical protein
VCAVTHRRACGSVRSRRETLDGVRAGGSRDMSRVMVRKNRARRRPRPGGSGELRMH